MSRQAYAREVEWCLEPGLPDSTRPGSGSPEFWSLLQHLLLCCLEILNLPLWASTSSSASMAGLTVLDFLQNIPNCEIFLM